MPIALEFERVKFRGHRCFSKDFAGFERVLPINILIGRNNSGKSHMLDFAEALCATTKKLGWAAQVEMQLSEPALREVFSQNTSGGDLGGNHWENHGLVLVRKRIRCDIDVEGNPGTIVGVSPTDQDGMVGPRTQRLRSIVSAARFPLAARVFRRLAAERNIVPEGQGDANLHPDGRGATTLIRQVLLHASQDRRLVQKDLLQALREIFGSDGAFSEITVRQEGEGGTWEVFLYEDRKGLVRLSQSGSGLKTIILVLLNLLVIPKIQAAPAGYAFGFEELENNLHPALLRRLLKFLENHAVSQNVKIFLTTHSSVALDVFAVSKNAQIIRVSNDGSFSTARTLDAHLDRVDVVSELGAKASDLLQANGIIWVEGPSDRIYLNHFIDLFSGGAYREGRDYQCAFYGGALLAQVEFRADETTEDKPMEELANLFRLNHNLVVVCDGDRTASEGEGSTLKTRVTRIEEEVKPLPSGYTWVTGAKEIENYLPGAVLDQVYGLTGTPSPGLFERFFPSEAKDSKGDSFAETHLKRKSIDKVKLAIQALPHLTKDSLAGRFDLAQQMTEIIRRIAKWNE